MKYTKIRPIDMIDCEKIIEVKFDDLDVNKHVNNSNYIVWALEPLDFKFRQR